MKEYNNIPKLKKAVEQVKAVALKEAALIVEAAAKTLSPVDTGNLRGSITHEVNPDNAKVGTNVEYSPYVEYGTSKMSAQPYLRPALDNNIEAIKKKMKEKYGVEIDKVAKEGGG